MKTSLFFYKELTAAEVGATKTHETYIRLNNSFDYELFFHGQAAEKGSVVECTIEATNQTPGEQFGVVNTLRFVYYVNNSNKEKRIPGLAPLFAANGVKEGDVICIECREENEEIKYFFKFIPKGTIKLYGQSLFFSSSDDVVLETKSSSARHLKEPLQLIYYGAPGTGKSFAIDEMTNDDNTVRTTFHPDSDYASFVGAYKPTMASMPIHAFVGTTVHHANNAANEKAYEKKIVYKYVPQAFLKAYVAAWRDLDNPHFLVIEEINRGNCAQIFGDLFQLLDRNSQGASSYAIHADEDIAQFLATDKKGFADLSDEQKDAIRSFVLLKDNGKTEAIGEAILKGEKLLLPPNLYIWATMNTSDQSLFPIDSAFKRRWNWRYVPIKFFDNSKDISLKHRSFEVDGTLYSWASFLRIINPIISTLTESADKQMGFFFAKPDKKSDPNNPDLKDNDVISEEIFLNKVLFYLWTDVLKDYNIGREEFQNPDKPGHALEFADFFEDDKNHLSQFIAKLGVAEIGEMAEEEVDEDGYPTNESQKRISVIVNEKKYSLRRAFLEITRTASEMGITFDAIKQAASSAGFDGAQFNRLFLKEEEKQEWLDKHSEDSKIMQRYYFDYPLTTNDGVKFYATGQGWINRKHITTPLEKYAQTLGIPCHFEE